MMRLLLVLAAVIGGVTPGIAREWKTIRIATEGAYPPFNDIDASNRPVGFDVDIARALCMKLQADCRFTVENWDAMIPALDTGKFDAIVSSMPITPERRRRVAFTNSYYDMPSTFAAPKDSPVAAWNASGLKGRIVGVLAGSSQEKYLRAVIRPGGAEIRGYRTQQAATTDLAIGRLDAVFADKLLLSRWLGRPEAACCIAKADVDPGDYPQFFGEGAAIAVRRTDTDLAEAFNRALAAILADGTYRKINEKYFPFSIY